MISDTKTYAAKLLHQLQNRKKEYINKNTAL